MAPIDSEGSSRDWDSFVQDAIAAVDLEWATAPTGVVWRKSDGSAVTPLDFRIDTAIKVLAHRYFPATPVLSEESGMLEPLGPLGPALMVVDPVDGTESLIANRDSWWVSVGLIEAHQPLAGFIYQPARHRVHTSSAPTNRGCVDLVVGMSPDQLSSAESANLRSRLAGIGATCVSTPHAVEKVAAVIEGRATATIALPSEKSPFWRPWDLAACVALASSSRLVLRTLDGRPLRLDSLQSPRSDPWVCAHDERAWSVIIDALDPEHYLR